MMEIAVLNAGAGDYKAEFDTDDESARDQLEGFIADMLGKGFALFLEEGDETHRILGYDPAAQTFEVVSARHKGGRTTIQVKDSEKVEASAQPASPAKRGGRGRRVTAVAPGAGG